MFLLALAFGSITSPEQWDNPTIIDNPMQRLKNELYKVKKGDIVFVCNTTDPFMRGRPDISTLHVDMIKYLNVNGIYTKILTKGFLPEELSSLSKNNIIGVSCSLK